MPCYGAVTKKQRLVDLGSRAGSLFLFLLGKGGDIFLGVCREAITAHRAG